MVRDDTMSEYVLPIGCANCDNRWSGTQTSHCGACHKSFTCVSNFDKHLHIDYRKTVGYARCAHPMEVGLVDAGRNYECWRASGEGTDWWSKRG